MINFLCNNATVSIVSDWVGIIGGIISSLGILIITGISIALQWKQSSISSGINAWMPLKMEIFNTIKDFISEFYYSCTVPLSVSDFSNIDLKQKIEKLDIMLTELFGVITSLEAMNLKNEDFLTDIRECCESTEILVSKYKKCMSNFESDMKIGIDNKNKCEELCDNKIKCIEDILNNQTYCALYTFNMSRETKDYLDQYKKLVADIDKLDFKSFMRERNIF